MQSASVEDMACGTPSCGAIATPRAQSKLEADGSADFKVGDSTFKLTKSMVSIVKEPTKVRWLSEACR